jgi:hypothetical protein
VIYEIRRMISSTVSKGGSSVFSISGNWGSYC